MNANTPCGVREAELGGGSTSNDHGGTAYLAPDATAVTGLRSHDDLVASCARLLTTTDVSRRRLERDLQAQIEQLVTAVLELRAIADATPSPERLRTRLSGTSVILRSSTEELQKIARALTPPVLSRFDLRSALGSLARRSPIPVETDVRYSGRLADTIELIIYHAVSEAIDNAVLHAQASSVRVNLAVVNDTLQLSTHDDGVGGAEPAQRAGLINLRDRVQMLGGTLTLLSPVGVGTSLFISVPSGESST
jgi:signal transduction histidine kinase